MTMTIKPRSSASLTIPEASQRTSLHTMDLSPYGLAQINVKRFMRDPVCLFTVLVILEAGGFSCVYMWKLLNSARFRGDSRWEYKSKFTEIRDFYRMSGAPSETFSCETVRLYIRKFLVSDYFPVFDAPLFLPIAPLFLDCKMTANQTSPSQATY